MACWPKALVYRRIYPSTWCCDYYYQQTYPTCRPNGAHLRARSTNHGVTIFDQPVVSLARALKDPNASGSSRYVAGYSDMLSHHEARLTERALSMLGALPDAGSIVSPVTFCSVSFAVFCSVAIFDFNLTSRLLLS